MPYKTTVLILGCDGYIGNALVQSCLFEGYKVIGVDNLYRRNWIKDEMNSDSAIPIKYMSGKEKYFREIGDFDFYFMDITREKDLDSLSQLINERHPSTIVNLAHNPSAPYSQISRKHANDTLINNITGTNNILWLIKDFDCHYITIGTTGEYDHYSNIDIEEGYFEVTHRGRKSNELIYPRRPGSIYHCSKTSSTYLIDFLTRAWNLKCTDIQQSIVFGSYTDEIDKTEVYSRLDVDEAGGTVLNRFIVQALIGQPLTIYGEGNHQRGFISLNDSIQALSLAIKNPADKGKVQVWNQLSEWHSINDLAKMVQEVIPGTEIEYIHSPRPEYTGYHYYNYVTEKLKNLGYKPTRSIKKEIEYVANLLKQYGVGKLSRFQDVVYPRIKF